MNTNENPWTIISSEEKYSNPWIAVTHSEVLNPNGNPGIYGTVHFKNRAIGIIVLDDEMNTYLIGQFRFPINKFSWEIPEGGGAFDCLPLEAAKRELMEELGAAASDWQLIQEMDLSNSATDEKAYIYVARKLTFYQSKPDDTEKLTIKKIPFNDFYNSVVAGEIRDAITISACYRVKLMLLNGQL